MIRTDNPQSQPVHVEPDGTYSFPVGVGSGPAQVTFCVDELEAPPTVEQLAAVPRYDPSPTTASVDGWLAEARPPAGTTNATWLQYYSSWQQFWPPARLETAFS